MRVVEEAFREKGLGRVEMPPKSYLFFKKYDGDLRVMPAYIAKLKMAGVKIVNSHPKNAERFGLPSVLATVVLVDPKNGLPTAIMGANALTSVRTGAAGGLAARYLAREDSKMVAVFGAGVQARTQIQALLRVRKGIELIKVYDLDTRRASALVDEISRRYCISAQVAGDPEAAAKNSDIIVTTTPSRKPFLSRKWVKPGAHINAVGADAPGKQELDHRILREAKVVVDDWSQASHGGEVNVAVSNGLLRREDIYGELGEIVCGKLRGREFQEEVTVFDSTGLAIQDISVAAQVYEAAVRGKRGQEVDLWGRTRGT